MGGGAHPLSAAQVSAFPTLTGTTQDRPLSGLTDAEGSMQTQLGIGLGSACQGRGHGKGHSSRSPVTQGCHLNPLLLYITLATPLASSALSPSSLQYGRCSSGHAPCATTDTSTTQPRRSISTAVASRTQHRNDASPLRSRHKSPRRNSVPARGALQPLAADALESNSRPSRAPEERCNPRPRCLPLSSMDKVAPTVPATQILSSTPASTVQGRCPKPQHLH